MHINTYSQHLAYSTSTYSCVAVPTDNSVLVALTCRYQSAEVIRFLLVSCVQWTPEKKFQGAVNVDVMCAICTAGLVSFGLRRRYGKLLNPESYRVSSSAFQ